MERFIDWLVYVCFLLRRRAGKKLLFAFSSFSLHNIAAGVIMQREEERVIDGIFFACSLFLAPK